MFYYIEEKPQSLFFDLIPKNATTSVLNSLVNYGNPNKDIVGDFYIYENLPDYPTRLNDDLEFINKLPYMENLFKVTCFRDPYLRVVSAFADKILNSRVKGFKFTEDFFIMYGKDLDVFRNDKIKYFDIFVDLIENFDYEKLNEHVKPQTMILKFEFKEYNKIFNFSTISEDWKDLTNIFPLLPDLPKQKVNKSTSDELLKIFQGRNLNKIKKIYEQDYEALKII
jgi:hypothetical protein